MSERGREEGERETCRVCGVNAVSCVVHAYIHTHKPSVCIAIAPLSDTCTFIIHTLTFENASYTNRDETEEKTRTFYLKRDF